MSTAARSQQPDRDQRQDSRVVKMAELIFRDRIKSSYGVSKSAQHNFAYALAWASVFYEQIDADPWTATAEQRLAAITQ